MYRLCCPVRWYGNKHLFCPNIDSSRIGMQYRQHAAALITFTLIFFAIGKLLSAGTCGPKLQRKQTPERDRLPKQTSPMTCT
jgi:hypothetical protein